ncbi:uncharacterized protein LOC110940303 isoform X2 [Helianthus annuus]|uniref:uncharacterized protein LOC110940303 isoform X2 n=1 Tax=Helianthus annuus TaxID=4232 RepID=UPI001652C6D0|nr:uncharacterized protein LOC110940303 isoform X2 [Helianthus annuus]
MLALSQNGPVGLGWMRTKHVEDPCKHPRSHVRLEISLWPFSIWSKPICANGCFWVHGACSYTRVFSKRWIVPGWRLGWFVMTDPNAILKNEKDALDVFQQLPLKHYNTAWVLSQVGKAHFELVDYIEAERAFSNARLASPYSLEGMDVYSTVLYHLKEHTRLSNLAQELISTDRLALQSW